MEFHIASFLVLTLLACMVSAYPTTEAEAEGEVNATTNDRPVETRNITKEPEATETEAPKGSDPIGSGAIPVASEASSIQVPETSDTEANPREANIPATEAAKIEAVDTTPNLVAVRVHYNF